MTTWDFEGIANAVQIDVRLTHAIAGVAQFRVHTVASIVGRFVAVVAGILIRATRHFKLIANAVHVVVVHALPITVVRELCVHARAIVEVHVRVVVAGVGIVASKDKT